MEIMGITEIMEIEAIMVEIMEIEAIMEIRIHPGNSLADKFTELGQMKLLCKY